MEEAVQFLLRYGYWDSLPAQKPTVAAGGGICPRAPVEGGRRQDVVFKKILSCLTKFDEERANKLMMSCRLRNCRNRKKEMSGKLSGAQRRKCC